MEGVGIHTAKLDTQTIETSDRDDRPLAVLEHALVHVRPAPPQLMIGSPQTSLRVLLC